MVGSLRTFRRLVLVVAGALSLMVVWDLATFGSTAWSAAYDAGPAAGV